MQLLNPPLIECKTPEKPPVVCLPSKRYGVPQGTPGRNGQTVKGIVIHCLDNTLEGYAAQVCGDVGKLSRGNGPKASLHYGIGMNGNVQQYVSDDDIAWGLDFTVPRGTVTPIYRCPDGCPAPSLCDPLAPPLVSDPNYLPDWTLTTENPGIPFDYYLLHIGVEASGNRVSPIAINAGGCGECSDGNTGQQFTTPEVWKLVQLVAYLADFYSIPQDRNHINFWHNIDPCERDECGCTPCIANLLCEVDSYCQGPLVAADPTYVLGGPLSHVYGQTKFGDKTAQATPMFFLNNLRVNAGVLEVFDAATNTWLPIPTV